MSTWNQFPLFRLLLPFLIGIIVAIYFPVSYKYSLHFLFFLFTLISSIVLVPKWRLSYRRLYSFGILVHAALFILGYQLILYKTENRSIHHFSNYTYNNNLCRVRLLNSSIEKEKSFAFELEVLGIKNGTDWVETKGKAIAYLEKDNHVANLSYGDELLIKATFNKISPSLNPQQFDYGKFLAYKNIYNQVYIKSDCWKKIGINSGNILVKKSSELRDKLLDVFVKQNLGADAFSVAAALLLGYVNELDMDLISAYANTGTLHILSVSGLHVGIIFIAFNFLLAFLDKFRRGYILKAILLVLFLWFYATLTGLSPAVLRATTMFSFVIVGRAFKQYVNIYNILLASAFLLLLINPYLIMDIGFQLSYLAVIGIVYFQPKIYAWWESTNWLLDQIWKITTVSIAAQLITFPLGLFYFHQFPNSFLFSNLLIIPLSTIIIYLGILVFVFSSSSLILPYLFGAFSNSLRALNFLVKWIDNLPYSVLQGISIGLFETFLFYTIILLLLLFFIRQRFNYLLYALSVMVALLFYQVVEQFNQQQNKQIVVYSVSKKRAIDFIYGNKSVLLIDSANILTDKELKFSIKNNWYYLGVSENEVIFNNYRTNYLHVENNYIQFDDKRIVFVNKALPKSNKVIKPLKVDYLIVSNNIKTGIQELLKFYNASMIIFDSSNKMYKTNEWIAECMRLNQPYHSVPTSGAFILKL